MGRTWRHIIFWLCWVLGFTFVKALDGGISAYVAWLTYYLFTLPVFMAHSYLLVYFLAPRLMRGWWNLLFGVVFLVLIVLFSYIEIFIDYAFLGSIFPEYFGDGEDIGNLAAVFINGIGNLYIVLVFIAVRMVYHWYESDDEKERIIQTELEMKKADANAGIQPEMLLYLSRATEGLVDRRNDLLPESISGLSELMNEVMLARDVGVQRFSEEVALCEGFLKQFALVNECEKGSLQISGGIDGEWRIRSFMLFSVIEFIAREAGSEKVREIRIHVNAVEGGEVKSYRLKYVCGNTEAGVDAEAIVPVGAVRQHLHYLYPGKYELEAGKKVCCLVVSIVE